MTRTKTEEQKKEIRVHLHEEQGFPDVNDLAMPEAKRGPKGAVVVGVLAVLCFGGGIAASRFDFGAAEKPLGGAVLNPITDSEPDNPAAPEPRFDSEENVRRMKAENEFYTRFVAVDDAGLSAAVPEEWANLVRLSGEAKAVADDQAAVLLWNRASSALRSAERKYAQLKAAASVVETVAPVEAAGVPVEPKISAADVLAGQIDELSRSLPVGLGYSGLAAATRQYIQAFNELQMESKAENEAVVEARRKFWHKQISETLAAVAAGADDLLPIARGQLAAALPGLYKGRGVDHAEASSAFPAAGELLPFRESAFFRGTTAVPDRRAEAYLKQVLSGLPLTHAARLFPAGARLSLQAGRTGWQQTEQLDFIQVPGGLSRDLPVESPFYMAALETTRQAMRCYKDAVRDSSEGEAFRFKRIAGRGPYAQATVEEAVRFCNWLSRRDGLSELYLGGPNGTWKMDLRRDGYRLPYADEWEYAARFGFDFEVAEGRRAWQSLRSELEGGDELVWFYGKQRFGPRSADPNQVYPLGFHDLCGNVEELCMKSAGAGPDRDGRVDAAFVAMGGGVASRSVDRVMPWSAAAVRAGVSEYGFRVVRAVPVEHFSKLDAVKQE